MLARQELVVVLQVDQIVPELQVQLDQLRVLRLEQQLLVARDQAKNFQFKTMNETVSVISKFIELKREKLENEIARHS